MRRRRRTQNAYAVTLFPFLAVLICTMGVLVVLLVVAVNAADFEARERAKETREAAQLKIDAVADSLAENKFREEGLSSFRPDVLKRARDAREVRAHIQSEIRKLDDTAQLLASQIQQLNQPPATADEDLTQLDEEIAVLTQRVQNGKEQLDAALAEQPITTTTYSIVPTDVSGTPRKPIYVECVNGKLVFQPQGITLTPRDFVKPIEKGNPLDDALVTIREYWKKYNLAGDQGDPYPLLVVRPSGAQAYALARHAMQSWEDEFGYELVAEDLVLEFGEPDTNLNEEIKVAVARSKARQHRRHVAEAIARRNGGGSNGWGEGEGQGYTGLTVDRENGGFAYQGGAEGQSGQANESHAQNTLRDNPSTADPWSGGEQQYESVSDSTSSTGGDEESKTAGGAYIEGGTEGGQAQGNTLEAVADQRGGDWALPNRIQNGTVYRRPIKVYCADNELIVESGASLRPQRVQVPINGSTASAVEPLVAEIWNIMEGWGFAGTGGYWKPELRIKVLPGGQQRAKDIFDLLDRSGFDLEVLQQQ